MSYRLFLLFSRVLVVAFLFSCAKAGDKRPFCGDGKVIAPEECDPPGVGACDAECRRDVSKCGDGVCESPERIDNCPEDCHANCGNGIRDFYEECDMNDLDGQNCATLGFAGGVLFCTDNCRFDTSLCETLCGDGLLDPNEQCDDGNQVPGDGCNAECRVETGWTCSGAPSVCTPICGDGLVKGDELCDTTYSGPDSCQNYGYYGGQMTCGSDCMSLSVENCAGRCGDGQIQSAHEVCDGTNLGGKSCMTQGFYSGTLSCQADCQDFVTTGCSGYCGDGQIQSAHEVCDGSNLGGKNCVSLGHPGGTLGCSSTCAWNVSGCLSWTAFSTGGGQTCGVRSDGTVFCWGYNGDGRCGNGTYTTPLVVPTQVSGIGTNGSKVEGGGHHACGIRTNGSAWCWGSNSSGQLGNGTTTTSNVPVAVTNMGSNVTAVSSGTYHSCGIRSGALYCWGRNEHGQLGDNSTMNASTPVSVIGMTSGVTHVSCGDNHTCARKSDGSLRCWGRNDYGQLGDNSTVDRYSPVLVSGMTSGVSMVSAGSFFTCAVRTDGSLRCWGRNDYGFVGDGSTTQRLTPVTPSGMGSGVQAVASGGHQNCALKTNQSIWCWGLNNFGQLGNGNTTDSLVPVQVQSLPGNMASVHVGGAHVCAVSSGGGAWCWGNNDSGRIGDGTTTHRSLPVPVTFP